MNRRSAITRVRLIICSALLGTILLIACKTDPVVTPPSENKGKALVEAPDFNADSAYFFIEKQVNFGPRIPNSVGHELTAAWLVSKLNNYTDTVYEQYADLRAYDGSILKSTNIIGAINPSAKKRMIVAAHWDTRPFADQDTENNTDPILGANDGGSGVGVILELARLIQDGDLKVGVDFILFDSEDYGQPANSGYPTMQNSYCLGSQYWAANPHTPDYYANFGILLDMVGATNATFTYEGTSVYFAKNYLNKVWGISRAIGYSDYFSYEETRQITDDHLYVNQIARIPMIDIIQYDRATSSGFGHYWHTHKDNMDIIDKNTLKAVGQTVVQTIYQFDSGNF